jgi:hypothetical protein
MHAGIGNVSTASAHLERARRLIIDEAIRALDASMMQGPTNVGRRE